MSTPRTASTSPYRLARPVGSTILGTHQRYDSTNGNASHPSRAPGAPALPARLRDAAARPLRQEAGRGQPRGPAPAVFDGARLHRPVRPPVPAPAVPAARPRPQRHGRHDRPAGGRRPRRAPARPRGPPPARDRDDRRRPGVARAHRPRRRGARGQDPARADRRGARAGDGPAAAGPRAPGRARTGPLPDRAFRLWAGWEQRDAMSTNGHTAPPADQGLDRAVLVVAGVVILGVIMSIFDTTIVNVALETLSRELNAPLNTIQWVSTGYLLSLAIVIPLTGWATERFGAKRVWMTSVALFGAGSALCGLAWSADSLIVFRIMQGLGGGMIMPVGMIVLTQTAGPHRVGRVMSVVGIPMLLGPVLGPVIGGLIVDNASWRWIFYVNIPIVVLALVLAARILPHDAGRADAGRLDWRGLLLLSPGAGLIVFGLSESPSHGGFGAPIV